MSIKKDLNKKIDGVYQELHKFLERHPEVKATDKFQIQVQLTNKDRVSIVTVMGGGLKDVGGVTEYPLTQEDWDFLDKILSSQSISKMLFSMRGNDGCMEMGFAYKKETKEETVSAYIHLRNTLRDESPYLRMMILSKGAYLKSRDELPCAGDTIKIFRTKPARTLANTE